LELVPWTQVLSPSGDIVLRRKERCRVNGEVSCALLGTCGGCGLALAIFDCLLFLPLQIILEDGVGEVLVLFFAPERDIALGERRD
jgi:hypothetical protein